MSDDVKFKIVNDNVEEPPKIGASPIYRAPDLQIYKTHPNVPDVTFGTKDSACFDLRYCVAGKSVIKYYTPHKTMEREIILPNDNAAITIKPRFRYLLPTGLRMQIPNGYSVRVHPRSGLAYKQGLTMVNCEGIIDSDYIQELFVLAINLTDFDVTINNNDRIAQAEMVLQMAYNVKYMKKEPKQVSDRIGGLGSTGVK